MKVTYRFKGLYTVGKAGGYQRLNYSPPFPSCKIDFVNGVYVVTHGLKRCTKTLGLSGTNLNIGDAVLVYESEHSVKLVPVIKDG